MVKKWIGRVKRKITMREKESYSMEDIRKWAYESNGDLRKRKDVTIGDYTYGCPNVRSGGGYSKLTIGKFCCIAKDVSIHLSSDHHLDWISTYDLVVLRKGLGGKYEPEDLVIKGNTVIGNDVWIGERVIILPGVTLHDGCVVGAGSIVTHDVEPYTIVAGNPARVIRKRFSDSEIMKLLEIKWWDWEDDEIGSAQNIINGNSVEAIWRYYLNKKEN